jgi:hypothetical protein
MDYYIISKKSFKKYSITKGKKYAVFRHKDRSIFFNDKWESIGLDAYVPIMAYNKSKYWKVIKTK